MPPTDAVEPILPRPAPVSRTVRVSLELLGRIERQRAAAEQRAGVPVDLRAVVEGLLTSALEAAEQNPRP